MSPREIAAGLRGFAKLHVVVVGDFFLDEYIESSMYEISKEGPIPVVKLASRTQTPGAAGNLASSIRNLGARVTAVGIVGADPNGRVLLSSMRRRGIELDGIIVDRKRPTLTYSKLRARVENTPSREILRMDVLPDGPLDRAMEDGLLRKIREVSAGADAIIVLDQIHHLITRRLLDEVPAIAKERGAFLQGSSRDHIADFHDFDCITPNDREAVGAVGGDAADVERLGRLLRRRGRHGSVLLTLGAEGMAAFPPAGPVIRLPTYARDVVDVTGAGDAVSSVTVLGNVLGWDLGTVAWAASHSAAIAIAEVGTHHVSRAEIERRILDAHANEAQGAGEPERATRPRDRRRRSS